MGDERAVRVVSFLLLRRELGDRAARRRRTDPKSCWEGFCEEWPAQILDTREKSGEECPRQREQCEQVWEGTASGHGEEWAEPGRWEMRVRPGYSRENVYEVCDFLTVTQGR